MEALFGLLLAAVFVVSVFLIRSKGDEEFDAWFSQLLECAPDHGYSQAQIDDFEELYWYTHYSEGLEPCKALETEQYK